ncbi:MAG: cytochrome c peroxidase [Myxococcota bacterium]
MLMVRSQLLVSACAAVALSGCGEEILPRSEVELGRALFEDVRLSVNEAQSCATCHDPSRGFVDARAGAEGRVAATSLGADGMSRGRRNAPTVTYATLVPAFTFGSRARFNKQSRNRLYEGPLGGLFHDGRADDLEAQAGGPPLNPAEMGMPSKAAVVERLRTHPDYLRDFEALYGTGVLDDAEAGYDAMTRALAAFERSPEVSPFDSKYDRFLRGEAELSFPELTGRSLFFSEFANCAICHQLRGNGDPIGRFEETFSGYEFHNLGVPRNEELGPAVDEGLGGALGVSEHRGRFRTPTLRNVAVTGPYMHNGVFRELRTVLEFYDRSNNPERVLNPETGQPWADAEVPETVAMELLEVGRPLTDPQLDALECFLRTLTDARFESLLPPEDGRCVD